mmetsp:Transcript_77981/g.253000  ORF Transcript_77981/g.253000 Transcript_77981/m.253000 type:complete len:427 (+) Transcript_77981:166-1446(+)
MEGDQEPPLPAADSEASAAFVPEELPQEDMDFAQDGAEAGEDANLTMLDGEHAEEQRSRTPSDAAAQAALPFDPPESVRKWLRDEDWNALKKAWSDAESRAMSWEAGDVDDLDPGLWEDESGSGAGSSAAAPAAAAARELPNSPVRQHKKKPKGKKPWNDNIAVTSDHRHPPPMRRYFDEVPGETSPPRKRNLPPLQQYDSQLSSSSLSPKKNPVMGSQQLGGSSGSEAWIENWSQMASTDNDIMHPHLRHYFDRRGYEASFRQRPTCDSPWNRSMQPRSPRRPTNQELIMRHSQSLPTLGSVEQDPLDVKMRCQGSTRWGRRCLIYGQGKDAKPQGKQKIPWVEDHHLSETEDNTILNPMLRHYFDAEGLEASFRNRGRHYNRPLKSCFGMTQSGSSPTAVSSMTMSPSASAAVSGGGGSRRSVV